MAKSEKYNEIKALKAALKREQKKVSDLKSQHQADKTEIKNLKRRKDPDTKSKKRSEGTKGHKGDREAKTVSVESISRYRYDELAIRLAVLLFAYAGCSSHQIPKIIEIINLLFSGIAGEKPSHQTVIDWVVKAGFATSNEDYDGKSLGEINAAVDGKYHVIIDNSISNNKQEIHLELASPSQHLGHTIEHKNVHVASMSVDMNWTGEKIQQKLEETSKNMGSKPEYVTSDNGRILSKACAALGITQHKDISHTLGMYLQQVYEDTAEYKHFKDRMSYARKFSHTDIGHLLPPKQRAIARFMNEFERVDWAYSIRENFMLLSSQARFIFGFVNELGSFIDEMKEAMDCFRKVESLCKEKGLSHATAKECRTIINECLMMGSERQQQLGRLMQEYFHREEKLLESESAVHNISSDIIESSFGYLKFRISSNKNNGFTPLILLLPLHIKVADINSCEDFNVKSLMEQTRYADIDKYRQEKLMPNPASDRHKLMKIASGF